MKLHILISLSCLVIVSHLQRISGERFAECDNLSSGAFIGGTKGCQSYIYCDGDESYEGFCPSQLLFNTKDGSCAPASDVECPDETAPTTPPTSTTPSTTTTTVRVTTTTTTSRPATTTTTAIDETPQIDVESAEDSSDPLINSPTFSDVQTTQISTITTSAANEGVSTSRPTQVCPATDKQDEVIFLPSDVSCSEYFLCYHGTPVPMYCSGQLYFDYQSSRCELPERVNCKIGNVPKPDPRKECTINTYDYFPYPKNCNYFYKCISGFLSLQQCPIGFGWSEEMKLCLKLDQGRCPTRAFDQQSQAWLNHVF